MSTKIWANSADSHFLEPEDLWRDLPPRLADLVPRAVKDADGLWETVDRTLLGLVDGLEVGDNTIEVVANGDGRTRPSAELAVVNHPSSGPVLSDPHQTPFICQTEAFGLGPAEDDNCNAQATFAYVYRAADVGSSPSTPLPPGRRI